MKTCLLAIGFVIAALQLAAQPSFQKNPVDAGGRRLTTVSSCATNDGGAVIGGALFDSTWYPAGTFLLKTDAYGQLQWATEITNSVSTSSYDFDFVTQSQDSGFIALFVDAAWSLNPSLGLLKLDASGNISWSKTYAMGTNVAPYGRHSIKEAPNGDYIINLSANNSFCVLRTDHVGNLLWGQTLLGDSANGKCPGLDCEITAGGEILLSGKRGYDRMLVKLNQYGQVLWTKIIQDGGYTQLRRIIELPGGDFLAAGYYTNLSVPFGLLLRMDASGNTIWRKLYQYPAVVPDAYSIFDLQRMSNGDILFGGLYSSVSVVMRTDSMGNFIESHTIGLSGGFTSYETPVIDITADGQLLISCSGDFTTLNNQNYVHANPLLKINPAMGTSGSCMLAPVAITVTPVQEPNILGISSGITVSPVGTVSSGVTFSAAPLAMQLDEICQLIGMDEPAATNTFRIFPNPVNENESFTLSFADNFTGNIQLFDMKGSLADQHAVNGSATVQVTTGKLQKGIYLVRATNERNEVSTSKIVIE